MSELKKILTAGRYFKNKFGEKIYKIPISILGFTCPNIDGTISRGGCSFCENDSFSPNLKKKINRFKLNPNSKTNPYLELQLKQIEQQYITTKQRLKNKFNAKKFLIYFQSFSNTYAPFETLKVLYEKALSFEDVVGLSIGTRADCVDEKVLDFLVLLSKKNEIWIEYGVQSVYDETLKKINRGHDCATMKYWIKRSKEKTLNVCVHLIYGLPGETQEMMLSTLDEMIKLEVDSIKFHPLYVVKKTLLTNEFKKGNFIPISEELYIDTVVKSIKRLPSNVVVQRITAGIDSEDLLAPMWCKNKHQQIFNIRKSLEKEGFLY